MANKRLIYANAFELVALEGVSDEFAEGARFILEMLDAAPTVDAVEVDVIKGYLQKKLDEWNALGYRKYEPANMWGYNFIMACFDDLEARTDNA